MKITEKPAKHSKASYHDGEAISRLKAILNAHQLVKPDLREGDTWPNHDGFLEVNDVSGYSKGTIFVQVKTLDPKRINKRISYRFKDQKFFSYCKSMSASPILFIGVDRKSNIAYWEEITPKLIEELNSLTIYLSKEKIISDENNDYHKHWLNICEKMRKAAEFYHSRKENVIHPQAKKAIQKRVSVKTINIAKQKLKDLFVAEDLKYKYYYPFIDLLQPFFIDKRGEGQRKKLRQLFDITPKMENGFMERMINDKLVKIIGESLCFVIDQEKAQTLQKEMIDKGAIDLSTIIELF